MWPLARPSNERRRLDNVAGLCEAAPAHTKQADFFTRQRNEEPFLSSLLKWPMWLSRALRWRGVGFLGLLVFMMAVLVVSPLLPGRLTVRILTQVFFLHAFLVSLSTGDKKTLPKASLFVLWVLSVVFSIPAFLGTEEAWASASLQVATGLHVLLMIACAVAILAFVSRTRRVTLDTIFASIVAYLFVSLAFAQTYLLLFLWNTNSFSLPAGADFHVGSGFRNDMVYFSLVTLATLGYGDIVPKTDLARSLAVIEAVIGQFYMAALVAFLVGKFTSQSSGANPDD
jgi:voltage-gated potassium channel